MLSKSVFFNPSDLEQIKVSKQVMIKEFVVHLKMWLVFTSFWRSFGALRRVPEGCWRAPQATVGLAGFWMAASVWECILYI